MTRCPFSLSRLVKVTANGQVVYGYYSNKARGMRKKAAEAEAATEQPAAPSSGEAPKAPATSRSSQTWAMLR